MPTHATNALANASSAYLRSAMHQPIQWNEWGEAAFARARQENKPILLDIGAVWCHWCHVMDRESYDSAAIAEIINERFIAIKVDRDERPDVDSRYQAAVHAISGQGGWPLTAFLTPEGKPFFGGTYFPPDDLYGRPGFAKILLAISEAFEKRHGEVLESADAVMGAIAAAETFAGRSSSVNPRAPQRMVESALHMFDADHGGFGKQPKFPHPSAMDVLLDRLTRNPEDKLRNVVTTTLSNMARGGIYDHLAGGFHRYSVDAHWRVPHFEKMSYDNSELLKNYVHAFQATAEPLYAFVARDIIRWMDEWLSDRERGGFYASQDADYSMEDDGDYFTWTLEEARAALDPEEFEAARLHFGLREVGDMHHDRAKNVLHIAASVEVLTSRLNRAPEEVNALLGRAREKMYVARKQRPTPYVDKTVYTSWNALCVSAYLDAARVLGLEEPLHFALRSLDRILAEAWKPGEGLAHVIAYSDPEARPRDVTGMLDDYAFTAIACLDAYEATADMSYFRHAQAIGDLMIGKFNDATGGGFFDTEVSASQSKALGALAAQRKPLQDTPTPAGNSAAAIALLRLYSLTNDRKYREIAEDTLEAFAGVIEQYGIFAATYINALIRLLEPYTQVVIVGTGSKAEELERAALSSFSLNKAVIRLPENEAVPQNLPPALAETTPQLPAIREGRTVAVVCSGFTCQPPVERVEELVNQLSSTDPATTKR